MAPASIFPWGDGGDGHSLGIVHLGTPPPGEGFSIVAVPAGDNDSIEKFGPP